MPNASVPAAAPGLPSSSRRRLLLSAAAASALLTSPAATAGTPHPDTAILAHRPVVLAALAAAAPHKAEAERLAALAEAEAGPEAGGWGAECQAWHLKVYDLKTANGGNDAWERWIDALRPIDAIREVLVATPARTLEGLSLKALVAGSEDELDEAIVDAILDDLRAIEAARVSA